MMHPRPPPDVIASTYPDMTENDLEAYDFKSSFIRIINAMEDANHPDVDLFSGYAWADIMGGFTDDEEGEKNGHYLNRMLEILRDHPEQRLPTRDQFAAGAQ